MSAANSECPPSRSEKDDGGHWENTLISVVSFIGWPLMEGSDLRLAPPRYGSFPQDLDLSALILHAASPNLAAIADRDGLWKGSSTSICPARQEEQGNVR